MTRRSSAFSEDLADLDALQSLPLAAQAPSLSLASPSPAPDSSSKQDEQTPALTEPRARGADTPTSSSSRGTRATQVRLPPPLASWLSQQAQTSGRTLGTVIALAAKAHAHTLPLPQQPKDELDVPRRSASGNVPVTLRLTSVQRQLLDDLASRHQATRSAIVIAALSAARDRKSLSYVDGR